MTDETIDRGLDPGDLDALFAKVVLGCRVEWSSYYHEWCCGCDGPTDHCIDQQCSMIANYSDNSRWFSGIDWTGLGFAPDPMESPLAFVLRAIRAYGYTHVRITRGELVA